METADQLRNRAGALLRAGRAEESIAAYGEYLALRPDDADAWYNIGFLQRQARRYADALSSYDRALALSVADPQEVHLNRGVIFADHLARPDLAQAELDAALAIDPDYVAALLNLGNLHEDRGRRAEAQAAYERILAIDPADPTALSRLANASVVTDAGDPILARLRQALARPDLSADDRASIGFALGRALDSAGDYDAAFAAYRTANDDARTAGRVRYDAKAAEALIDRIIAAFPARTEAVADGPAPIFICGMFRSGSTLAEQILASHSRVTAGGELELLPALIAETFRPYPEAAAHASPDTLDRVRRAYHDGVRAAHPDGDIVTDKRPDNFLHIGLIKRLFPNARIVHTRRQPIDNILSIYFLQVDPAMAYAFDLADAAHWYGQYSRLMAHWHALYSDDIHSLDYDKLVADPRETVARLLAFCGLPWEDECLSFHTRANAVRTASVWQVREPLHRRASGRWRNYETHLGALRGFGL